MSNYTIRRYARSRHLRLALYPDGRVLVTAPKRLSLRAIEKFVAEKQAWLEAEIAKQPPVPKVSLVERRRTYLQHKKEALIMARERIAYFNAVYQVNVTAITIRDQRSRWGSCSRDGRLSFNYRIAVLAPELRDYIIVHELCHLIEFNHSLKFWAAVARMIPNHLELRRRLKREGITLH